MNPRAAVLTLSICVRRGKFATVRRCVHRESGRDFAAKYIRKRRRASDVRHEILHEALVLKMAEPCPRVVDVREVFETPSELILILELAAGGELQHVLDSEECLPEKDVVRLMRQILEAVHFLHDRNIAHLDIKPQNLLLTSSFPQGDILLCDFGISRVIGKGTEIREIVGTPDYVAPEILQYEPISLATDIWSLGVLTYVLLSGHSPFGGDTKQETFCNITNGSLDFPEDLFGDVSASAKDFIGRLIVRDASKRLSVKDCLSHPWLAPVKASMLPSPTKAISQIQPLASGSAFGSASSDSSASEDSDEAPTSKPALPTSAPPTLRPSIRFYHDVDDDDDVMVISSSRRLCRFLHRPRSRAPVKQSSRIAQMELPLLRACPRSSRPAPSRSQCLRVSSGTGHRVPRRSPRPSAGVPPFAMFKRWSQSW
ncbi:hypothetical protein V5799_003084 [Amblyomma americanum]|uniref:non-specific serine/threonine protein kinase n=1 Tax=Amblyomma americanum TaxID=6943 RepID=A0AAQ4D9Z4_AMBAM